MTPEERARRLMSGQWPDECVTTYDAAVAAIREAVAEAIAPLEAENTRLSGDVRDLKLAIEQMTTLADEYAADKRALVAENTRLSSALREVVTAVREYGAELKAARTAGGGRSPRLSEATAELAIRLAEADAALAGKPAVPGTADNAAFRQPGEPEGLPRSGPQKELKP